MTKKELELAVKNAKTETHDSLKLLYDSLNNGQQKKLLKDEKVKELLERYGVV